MTPRADLLEIALFLMPMRILIIFGRLHFWFRRQCSENTMARAFVYTRYFSCQPDNTLFEREMPLTTMAFSFRRIPAAC